MIGPDLHLGLGAIKRVWKERRRARQLGEIQIDAEVPMLIGPSRACDLRDEIPSKIQGRQRIFAGLIHGGIKGGDRLARLLGQGGDERRLVANIAADDADIEAGNAVKRGDAPVDSDAGIGVWPPWLATANKILDGEPIKRLIGLGVDVLLQQ